MRGLRRRSRASTTSAAAGKGSDVQWSSDWDDSFDDEVIDRVSSFLEAR